MLCREKLQICLLFLTEILFISLLTRANGGRVYQLTVRRRNENATTIDGLSLIPTDVGPGRRRRRKAGDPVPNWDFDTRLQRPG